MLTKLWNFLGSFALTITILGFMFIVTFLGTIVQETRISLYDTQRIYFESLLILHPVGDTGIVVPLPGAALLMAALSVNLLVGGILRIKWRRSRAGILITHFGIAFLMLSGLVKFVASEEGTIAVWEGEDAREYVDPNKMEIVIYEPLGDRQYREFTVPQAQFEDLRTNERATIRHPRVPFELEVFHYQPNCWLAPGRPGTAGALPVIDGHYLRYEAPAVGAKERNVPGCYVTATRPNARPQTGILWAVDAPPELVSEPWTVDVDGAKWGVKLRAEVRELPFEIKVDDFRAEFHPGISMARSFSSDITVIDGDEVFDKRIQMNDPLRREGYTLYQTNWGPQEKMGRADRHYTVFAVARNPSDQWPKWACYVIGLGLTIHFGSMLLRYIAKERRAQLEVTA